MDVMRRGMRRTGLFTACLASLVIGLVLAWRFVTPQSLAMVSTGELVTFLALFVLPLLSLGAVAMERSSPAPRRPV